MKPAYSIWESISSRWVRRLSPQLQQIIDETATETANGVLEQLAVLRTTETIRSARDEILHMLQENNGEDEDDFFD